jgi:hypothetical protein
VPTCQAFVFNAPTTCVLSFIQFNSVFNNMTIPTPSAEWYDRMDD